MRQRVIWIDGNGLAQRCLDLLEVSEFQPRDAEVVQGHRLDITRVDTCTEPNEPLKSRPRPNVFDEALEVRDGLGEAAHAHQPPPGKQIPVVMAGNTPGHHQY